jgi:hypothetical protein
MNTRILPTNINVRSILFFGILLCVGGICRAQFASAQVAASGDSDYAVTQMGPHSRIWRNSAGQSVTEIATGMNYWDGQEWTPSDPSFQVSPDGTAFVAARIQDPTRLAANLNCVGAVTVITPDNVTLSSTPIAIGLYDAASGKSAIVATVTNTTGVLADPQHVVYDRAFVGGGFAAGVVYSLPDTGSFHQDVVFVGFDPGFDPTVWGFAAGSTNTLQIQVFTEFYDPPQPQMLTNPIYVEQNPATRASMASPDLIDYTLDFGHYVFGLGRAYTTAAQEIPSVGVRTVKNFVTFSGRTFLVESIPYRWLASDLGALPPTKVSSLTRPPSARRTRVAAASLPRLREVKQGSVEKIIPTKTVVFDAAKPRGVVVDYIVTVSSLNEPKLYASDTTYYVSGTVYETSAVTMESAVFKYPTNNIGAIEIENTLTSATTNYRPAVFTAADDNTAGTALSTNIWSGYTGNPSGRYYGNAGLYLSTASNIALNNLRFCYMSNAIYWEIYTSGQAVTLSHSQLVDCGRGIYLYEGSGLTFYLYLNNCLMASVQNPFVYNGSTPFGDPIATMYDCTIDSWSALFTAPSGDQAGNFAFIDSILSSGSSTGPCVFTGNNNGFYNSPTFGSSYVSVSSNPYQTAGAGNYYLSAGSPFLTNGTTNVGAKLLSQLQAKTTQPPLVLTNSFINNTVLTPVAQRDTVGTVLGFHYDPIDYIAAFSVSNAILLLTNGVALAYYDDLGVWLQDGAQLVSQGAPNQRNYLVYYGLVQEQPVNLWGVTNAVAQSLPIAPQPFGSSANPSIYLRLTTICAPTGETNLLNTGDTGVTGQVISNLTLRDCEVYGAGANWQMSESNNTPTIGLTNNVFHRIPFAISNAATVASFNNLFYGTTNTNSFTVSIRHRGATSPNTNENNVFDGVTASLDGVVGYNAYLHGATNINYTNNNDIWTNITWLGGPLGGYYQATNSPLLTNGSTYATNLGLYHYTVMTNEAVEGTNIVSRGYHYVALGTNGLPLDTSGDGVPDYLADLNGNNSGGTGSWTNYISPNGLTGANGLVVFTPLK